MAGIDLKGKHVLLDTNVLIGINKRKDDFASVSRCLEGAELHYSTASEFEILRAARTNDDFHKMKGDLMARYARIEINDRFLYQATKIAGVYGNLKAGTGAGLTDCINAAILLNGVIFLNQDWYLVTADRNDFPIKFFDWLHFEPVEVISRDSGAKPKDNQNPEIFVFMKPDKHKFLGALREWSK